MIDWNPKPLPPEWMVELWAKLDNRWLNADTATVTGPWKVRSRGDAGGADDPIWIPYADGRPVSHEECVRRCLAAQEPPEGQEWIDQWTHAPASVTQRLADTGIVLPAADGGSWYRRHRPIAKPLPEPGDKAQPVDCRSPAGVAIGLIDGIIASCRVLRTMDLSDDEVREALEDVRQDEDVRAVCHPTHGGIPKSSSPTPKAPSAPPVGVWLGRKPTEEEAPHQDAEEEGKQWAVRWSSGDMRWQEGGIDEWFSPADVVDAAPARDKAHAWELCVQRRNKKPATNLDTSGVGALSMPVRDAAAGLLKLSTGKVLRNPPASSESSEREKGPQERELEELTGFGWWRPDGETFWGFGESGATDKEWATVDDDECCHHLWPHGGAAPLRMPNADVATAIEAASAALLARHYSGEDPLPCQRAEVPDGWEAKSRPRVADVYMLNPNARMEADPRCYLLADGTRSVSVDKGQWFQVIRRQPSDPYPEGLVALAQREACAGPRITLAPESVVTLTDEDRRELDALAAKVGIPTLTDEEDAEAWAAVGGATLTAVGEDVDPRIGHWVMDSCGDCGLAVARAEGRKHPLLYALGSRGRLLALYDNAQIITPPDPIPAPCRPVWEAFEALRRERERKPGKWAALDGVGGLEFHPYVTALGDPAISISAAGRVRGTLLPARTGQRCEWSLKGSGISESSDSMPDALLSLLLAAGVL